ncbi:MAG TPA: hypothetical protein VNO30_25910 [Kofleriaceae bacterium]|nr:hypothetical protein [Kofleriaceae bacterium]
MKGLATIIISFSALSLAPGCFVDSSVDSSGDRDDAHDDDDSVDPPLPPAPPPPVVTARGAYEVRSTFDLTASAVLPEPAYEVVETLHDFSTAPAHTLIDLAEAAGVPAVAELRAALPDSLESRLEGWIDDRIATVKINGVPVPQVAGQLAALAELPLTQFAIDSTLDVHEDGATHRLRTLDFSPAGLNAQVPVGVLPGDIVAAEVTASCKSNALTLGEHAFGLPYGAYAWRGIEAAVTAQYGAGIRDLLGTAVNCPALADTIASKCILSVCVGHRAQLLELCERGLDEVVGVAQRKMEALRFDAIRLEAGTATLAGAAADGTATRLGGGVWTAQINASQGLRPVPAVFTGAR